MTLPVTLRLFLPMLVLLYACGRPADPTPDLTLIHLNDVYRIDAVEGVGRGQIAIGVPAEEACAGHADASPVGIACEYDHLLATGGDGAPDEAGAASE